MMDIVEVERRLAELNTKLEQAAVQYHVLVGQRMAYQEIVSSFNKAVPVIEGEDYAS